MSKILLTKLALTTIGSALRSRSTTIQGDINTCVTLFNNMNNQMDSQTIVMGNQQMLNMQIVFVNVCNDIDRFGDHLCTAAEEYEAVEEYHKEIAEEQGF
jgi:hypothetical protein